MRIGRDGVEARNCFNAFVTQIRKIWRDEILIHRLDFFLAYFPIYGVRRSCCFVLFARNFYPTTLSVNCGETVHSLLIALQLPNENWKVFRLKAFNRSFDIKPKENLANDFEKL